MSYEVSILDCMLNSFILNPEVRLILVHRDDPFDSVEDGERWFFFELSWAFMQWFMMEYLIDDMTYV